MVQEAPRPQAGPLQSNSGRLMLGHARSFAAVKPTPAPARGKRLKAAMLRHPAWVGREQLTPDDGQEHTFVHLKSACFDILCLRTTCNNV